MCPMTPIVWIDWVGVIGVLPSIREETPPNLADGEGVGGNRKRMKMDMMMTMTSSVILMTMMMMNILVSSDPGHQSGHRHLPAWQMGKLPEGGEPPLTWAG